MKAKVLKYSTTEINKVVRSYKDLEKIVDNVYKYEYSSTYQDYITIVVCISGVYIEDDSFIERIYKEKEKDILDFYRKLTSGDNYLNCIEDKYKNKCHISLLEIEALKNLNKDVSKYLQLRKEREEQRKAEEEKKQKEEEQKEEQRRLKEEQKYKEELNKAKILFKEGKYIDSDLFIDLCKEYDIYLHIRTIGSIRKNITRIGKGGYFHSGRTRTNKIYEAAEELFEALSK